MTTATWEQKMERLLLELTKQFKQSEVRRDEQEKRWEAQRKADQRAFIQHRKELGEVSRRLGRIVEDIIAPDLPNILRELADCPEEQLIVVNDRVERRHPNDPGKKIEIDAMADCARTVIINETKSTLRADDVRHLLDDILPYIRDYFPEYREFQIIGCVASLHVKQDVLRFASKQGLVVLGMREGLIKVINPDGFQMRYF